MKNIYFIKHTEKGKYLNYKDPKNPYLVDNLISATPSERKTTILPQFEYEEISLEDFKVVYSQTVAELIIIGELFHHKASIYQDTIPVLPKLNKDVRKAVKNALNKMSFFHMKTNEMINLGQEDEVYEVSADFEELIQHVSEAFKGNVSKFNNVFRAMKKDEKSILGISKKILNN